MRNQRRTDTFFGKAHVTMGAAAAHLRSIGGQPAHLQTFPHSHFNHQLPQQQNALSTETRHLDGHLFEMMCMPRAAIRACGLFRQ